MFNLIDTRTWGLVLLLSAVPALAPAASQDPFEPTAIEVIQLPKFCYLQFNRQAKVTPEYGIPGGCGPGMNHYCYGLNKMNRARLAMKATEKRSLYGLALTDVIYTENWMKGYPSCPLRGHVEASKKALESMLGAMPKK